MRQTQKPLFRPRRIALAAAAAAAGLIAFAAYAATSQTIGSGTMDYAEVVDGPATLNMRTLTVAPGEVLGWHHHPGTGAYTVVVSGTLTVEDGCGGEAVYGQGQAFLEPPNRVHRGKNLTSAPVVTAQTTIVPLGTPTSVPHAQRRCGVPQNVEQCMNDAWRAFDFPERFLNQGTCIAYVLRNE